MSSVYKRSGRLWACVKDEAGAWVSRKTPYKVDEEEKARRYVRKIHELRAPLLAAAVWRLIEVLVRDAIQALLGDRSRSRGGGAGVPGLARPKRGARWLARDVAQELQDRGDQLGPGSLRVVLAAATSPVQPGVLDVAHVLEADLGSPSANRGDRSRRRWRRQAVGNEERGLVAVLGGVLRRVPMAAAEHVAYLYRHARLAEPPKGIRQWSYAMGINAEQARRLLAADATWVGPPHQASR
jgi:hypothetical protein